MKITVKTLGAEFTIEVENGTSYERALQVFEEVTTKSLAGMDLYANGDKVTDLTSEVADGAEVVAIKAKHESAALKITVKTLGTEMSVECDDDSSCSDALEVFQRISGKVVGELDVYRNGDKVADLASTKVEDGDELVAIKAKHESAK